MPHLLIVCTGNTCRSPIAEGLIRQHLSLTHRQRWTVSSAGIEVDLPRAASLNGQITINELKGISLKAHRSRPISAELMDQADLILCMTGVHVASVLAQFPDPKCPVLRFGELSDSGPVDVEDPYGGDLATYEAVVRLLDQWVQTGLDPLLERIEGSTSHPKTAPTLPDG